MTLPTVFSELASLYEGEWELKAPTGWFGRRKTEGWMHVQKKTTRDGNEEIQLTWTSHRHSHRVSFSTDERKQAYVINLDPAGELTSFAEASLSTQLVYTKHGFGSYVSEENRERGLKVLQRFHQALVVEQRAAWHPPFDAPKPVYVPAKKTTART